MFSYIFILFTIFLSSFVLVLVFLFLSMCLSTKQKKSAHLDFRGDPAASAVQYGSPEEPCVQGRRRRPDGRQGQRAVTAGEHAGRPQPVLHLPPHVQVRALRPFLFLVSPDYTGVPARNMPARCSIHERGKKTRLKQKKLYTRIYFVVVFVFILLHFHFHFYFCFVSRYLCLFFILLFLLLLLVFFL